MGVQLEERQRVPHPYHIHVAEDDIEAPVYHLPQYQHLGPHHTAPPLLAPLEIAAATAGGAAAAAAAAAAAVAAGAIGSLV